MSPVLAWQQVHGIFRSDLESQLIRILREFDTGVRKGIVEDSKFFCFPFICFFFFFWILQSCNGANGPPIFLFSDSVRFILPLIWNCFRIAQKEQDLCNSSHSGLILAVPLCRTQGPWMDGLVNRASPVMHPRESMSTRGRRGGGPAAPQAEQY